MSHASFCLIQCDICAKWYHFKCVSVASVSQTWYCCPFFFFSSYTCHVDIVFSVLHICDCLWINHPSTAKCKIWVQPKITARSARGQYLVYVVGVIYGVLATLWCCTKRQLDIVSPGVI